MKKDPFHKIFISCPFNKYLENGLISDKAYCTFTQELYELCRKSADDVFMALKREDYGRKPLLEYSCTLDLEEMKSSEIVVAIPENSLGVAVELGWAIAMKKRIVLLIDVSSSCCALLNSLSDITDCHIILYKDRLSEALPLIQKFLFQ